MQFQDTPYILPLVASSIIAGFVAFYAWQRRVTANGEQALALLALACAEWSLGYALEIAGADLPTKIFWGKSQYLGIVTIPLLWIIFAYSYFTHGNRMTRRTVSLLSIVPFITLLLAFTNEMHGLIWKDVGIRTSGTFSALDITHGFWFWIYWIYFNILLLVGAIFIFRSFNRTKGLFRRQNVILLIAVLTPWVGNVLYVSGLSPIPNLDITPFAFTISIVVFAWGISTFKLVDLAPVARDLVVEKMPDGMIVLDAHGNIVDINPAVQRALGLSASQAIGQRAKDLFSAWPSLVQRYENTLEAQDEIDLGEGETQSWYELRLSPLLDNRERLLGRVVTVRNITGRKHMEQALRLSEEKYRKIYENVADVIYETDNHGHLTSISPSVEKLGGFRPVELLGRSVADFFVFPEQYAALDALMIEKGSVNDFEALLRQKEGNTLFASITVHIIFDANGQGVATEGVLRDITERKQAEERIRQLNTELERRVIDRKKGIVGQIQGLLAELQKIEGEDTTPTSVLAALPPANPARFLKKGNFDLDLHARHAALNGRYIPVTGIYFDYLGTLLRHAPKAVAYKTLVKESQGYDASIAEARDLARWRIHELRKVIEADPKRPRYILTVRGTGYRLAV